MANLIQIKRSLTTATAPSLANGELAFTANGDHLFIGSNGATITIAGKFNPGVLTANQALVANGTGYLDAVKADVLTVRNITANGVSSPGAGYLLTVDAGGNTYWQPAGAVSINAASQYNWTNTHTFNANVTLATTAGLIANGGIGTAGQVLHSNGSSVYWAADDGITTVTAGDGLTGGGTSSTVTLNVVAANGIAVSADAVAAQAANGISVTTSGINVLAGTNGGLVSNSTGVFVSAGSGLVSNSTGLHVGSANGINVQADTVGLTTGSTLTVNATGAHVNTTLSLTSLTTSGDIQVGGNLSILGDLLTINVATLAVEDSLIQLAANNTSSDLLDIGFFGSYEAGDAGTHEHTGLFRDASDSGIYKLFNNLEESPTTTVNTAGIGYSIATLETYLRSGGLVSNSSAVTLTANATLAVNITANSLSLSTPLAVTSGGIGRASITAGAILVGNGAGATTVLAAATDGYVLQSNGTSVVYGTLDGGTF